jgi:cytochrome c2
MERYRTVGSALAVLLAACEGGRSQRVGAPPLGGDPERGHFLVQQQGCIACHDVPGVWGPRGHLGPSLDGFARHAFIAGELPNTPENLVRWITRPTEVHPRTAMPAMEADPQDVRDVAAYLYTLD